MAVNTFEQILEDLGDSLGLSGLKPDSNSACQLVLPTGLSLQLELDDSQENLLLYVDMGEVPPGAFRERLFEAALKDNGTASSNVGVIAYNPQTNKMLLWKYLPVTTPAAEVSEAIQMIVGKGSLWMDGIKNGVLPKTE